MARNQSVSAPAVAYAVASVGCASPNGVVYSIREGDTWAADDPDVLHNPGLFSDKPTRLQRSV